MDIYRDQIEKMVYELKKLLEDYTAEYKLYYGSDDESHLICSKNHGRDTYYRANKENGKYIRKSLNGDQDAINALARKEYLRIAMDSLENNIVAIETSLSKIEDLDFETIKSQMYKACRELPAECFLANGAGRLRMLSESNENKLARHRGWAMEAYEKSNYKPEKRRLPTSAGIYVRSKSEQHIVEQLVNYGVPFRYEQIIHIGDKSYSADFTFRDCNMELFYWEHAGMMDVQGYVNSYYRKMNAFSGAGIVPWKNLIITYDIDNAINIPMIKSIIENEVIPRM
jgi:hypothetical protein